MLAGGSAVAAALLTGCASPRSSALRVLVTGRGESDSGLLLRSAGLKPDFPVAYSEFQSGHLVVEAFNGGSLDYGGASEIPPIFAATTAQYFLIRMLHSVGLEWCAARGSSALYPSAWCG